MNERSKLLGIDALRGYAASAVLMLHATKIHPFAKPPALEAFTMYCAYGVPLFFVISAFSLAYGYSGRMDQPGWRVGYAIRRFFRIAPLFYIMIAVWTLYTLSHGGVYTTIEYLLNVTFTFGLVPGYQNSIVSAGWSIGAEMIFYALLPLFLQHVNSLPKALFSFATALGVSYAFSSSAVFIGWRSPFFYWTNIFTNMPYFVFGLLSYHLFARLVTTDRVRQWSNTLLVAAIGVVFLNVAVGTMPSGDWDAAPPPLAAVAGWAIAFGLLVTSQALMPNKIIANRTMLFFGAISFSLYLIHPIIIFTLPVFPGIAALSAPALTKALIAWAFAFGAVVPLAWLTYKLIEAPGQAIGKHLVSRSQNEEFAHALIKRLATPKEKALEDQP